MRSLGSPIEADIKKKFVFLSGPRQVGKTYLAKQIIEKMGGKYYNWDLSEDRQQIISKGFIHDKLVVLDELHKYDRWKNFIKGIYDTYHENLMVLVTGSARLDIYRKGEDSLLGRYFPHHLHPLTIGEIVSPGKISAPEEVLNHEPSSEKNAELESLMKLGGFPEPFYAGDEQTHNRWSMQRRELLVREDIRDLTNINLLSLIEHLMILLPQRVGSPLSTNSLKEDLQVAYNTVRSWLDTFERLFITFSIKPYVKKLNRSVHKEKKLYLWDWSQIKDDGARFENLVASHLWKAVSLWRDLGMGDFELWFLRDRNRREVDFCITKEMQPWLLIEAKLSETRASESLDYFSNFFNVPAVQLLKSSGVEKKSGGILVTSASKWLQRLP